MQASQPTRMSPALSSKSPPISKYFQPPGAGWNSPNRGPNQPGEIGASGSTESLPSLPARPLPSSAATWESPHLPRGEAQAQSPNLPLSPSNTVQPKLPVYSPQDYAPHPSGQQSPLGVPRPQGPDTSKWGVKYNHGYSRSQDNRPKPVLPPRPPQYKTQDDSNQHQPPSGLGLKAEQEGYRLQPVAYDPHHPAADLEDPRQSWQEGDDSLSIQTSPPTQPPPKPPKVPQDTRPGASQGLQSAPQLPPLYFESQPQVEQQDFAYARPPKNTNAQASIVPSKVPIPDIPRSDSVTILPVPYPPAEPSPPSKADHRRQKASPSLNLQNKSNQKSLSNQLSAVVGQNQVPVKSTNQTARPNDSTTQRKGTGDVNLQRVSQTIQIPQQQKGMNDDDAEDANNSFYFHSPQSSMDSQSPRTAPANDTPLPSKTVTSDFGLSSASALGFGGPSDWEHFGDYDAEEIDDEDLYVSTKPKTAELPAKTSPVEEPPVPPSASLVPLAANISSMAPSTDPPKGEQAAEKPQPVIQRDPPAENPNNKQDVEIVSEELVRRNSPPPSLPAQSLDSREHTAPNPMTQTTARAESPKLDEEATQPEQPVQNTESLAGELDRTPLPRHSPKSNPRSEDPLAVQAHNFPMEGAETQVDEAGKIHDRPDQNRATNIDIIRETSHQDEERGEGSDEAGVAASSIKVDGKSEEGSTILSNELQEHYDQYEDTDMHDDGGEDIIISLDMPDSPPTPSRELRLQIGQLQERTATQNLASQNHLGPSLRSPLEGGLSDRRSVFPKSAELEDPYANLDAWAKASLNRYVKMLREEALAETDEHKYVIFTNFTRRETRLRAVLYDMDEEPESLEQPAKRTPLKGSTSILTLRPSVRSKALPALPPGAQQPTPSPRELPMKLETPSRPVESVEEPAQQRADDDIQSQPRATNIEGQEPVARGTPEESYVMVESPTAESYTPGGRPVIPSITRDNNTSPLKVTPSLTSLRKALDVVGTRAGGGSSQDSRSPGANTPVGSASTISEIKHSETPRSNSVPLPSASDASTGATSISAGKPAYTPFQYNEGRPYEGDKAVNRQSIYMPFAGLLRESSQRQSSLHNGIDRSRRTSTRGGSVSSDTIPGVPPLPESLAPGNRKSMSTNSANQAVTKAPKQRLSVLEPLLIVVPPSSVMRPEPAQIIRVRQQIDAVPDDFAFIHDTVLTWHTDTKQIQEAHDRERHVRQGESEQRIDALFNDNEIGYSDISELEAEFKRFEASKKAEEDRAEYQSFVTKVFEVVWARLHYEMEQLTPLYDVCTQMLNDATAGREMFEDTGDRVPVAPAMDSLLALYQKLGIRHQKAFEAVLERDRRLKKNEVGPWYALGNIGQVKKIEKRFEEAERKAILEFCRQRDVRANLLMDVLDQNTLRGVGTNQDYMESVMQAIRKVALDVALGAMDEDTPISPDEVLKAKTITTTLARSSEQIVQTFHVADMLLNSADYEVSVANARLANADAEAFKRLREAKAKEDQKLVKDLEHRMSLIRGDTSRTQDEVTKLLSLIGSSPSDADPPRSTSAPADPDREARLHAALEEAKRRNAQKEGVVGEGFNV